MASKPDKLHLRLPAAKGTTVWEIDLQDDAAKPREVPAERFPDAVTLGDSNKPGDPYRLDLSELARTMESWVERRRRSMGSAGDSSADTSAAAESIGIQAGPHDVVLPVVREEADGKHLQFRLVCNEVKYGEDKSITSVTPAKVVTVTYPPTRAAMRALLRSGTILMFLQQTTFPIGFTCYLLNLLALDTDPDADPDRLL